MANARKQEKSKGKVKRVPFGGNRQKLQVDEIPGYVTRWFNDVDGRVERALDAGYEFVTPEEAEGLGQGQLHQENTDLGSRVSKIVSRGTDKVIRGVLMKIKREWYEEDQELKEQRNRMVDDALRAGRPGGNEVENQYVPKGHRQII